MPQFTITISDAALARLQAIVARYNADNGTNLTVRDWLLLHVKELAIQDELIEAARLARENAEKQAAQAFTAERDRLLGAL